MKACSKCGIEKPLDAFPWRGKVGVARAAQCKQCVRAKQEEWRKANREHCNRAQNARKVGLTLAEYALLDLSSCEVCADELDAVDNKAFLDHDHSTGRFRGVLCRGCNSALGFAYDDPTTLRALASYLEAKCAAE